MGIFGKKKSASEIAQARGLPIYYALRQEIDSYAAGSGLSAKAERAVDEFLGDTDVDLSWLFDPSFAFALSDLVPAKVKSKFSRAEAQIKDKLASIDRGARNAILIQDAQTVRETAITMLAESLLDWFGLSDSSGDRGQADWVVAYACSVEILESRSDNYVIEGHHRGIAFGILAFWSESPRRTGLRA